VVAKGRSVAWLAWLMVAVAVPGFLASSGGVFQDPTLCYLCLV